ncbi:hypothetical protein MJO28_016270, partial [Puccinia striiformis f. sp. tritici]
DGIWAASKLKNSDNDKIKEKIATQTRKRYNLKPNLLQVNSVMNIISVTGFDKLRIIELCLKTLSKDCHITNLRCSHCCESSQCSWEQSIWRKE